VKIEQRKYGRFIPQDDAFVAIGSKVAGVGRIKDLGMGGLAFEYIDDPGRRNPLPRLSDIFEHSQLSIFLSENEFHLSDVPCRTIYDILAPVSTEDQRFITSFKTRRCGVRFDALVEDQTAQLEFFIKTYVTGLLP
jgi:hypothetical protein